MKKGLLIFFVATLFACNNEGDTATKGNTDVATDSVTMEQDNTVNRDTSLRDTTLIDTGNRRDSIK